MHHSLLKIICLHCGCPVMTRYLKIILKVLLMSSENRPRPQLKKIILENIHKNKKNQQGVDQVTY